MDVMEPWVFVVVFVVVVEIVVSALLVYSICRAIRQQSVELKKTAALTLRVQLHLEEVNTGQTQILETLKEVTPTLVKISEIYQKEKDE